MLHFLADTAPAGGGLMGLILPAALFIGIFYFMLIRPENKRKKEAEQMRSDLKVGDVIVTIGGVMGKVVHIENDSFVMETGADQVRLEFAKWALSTNESGAARAKEAAQKAAEAKAREKAEKKAAKGK